MTDIIDNPVSRTWLGLWAHPDDEAYLSAGLMYEAIRRGDHVVVVTATPGEHGTSDPTAWPPHRLAVQRRAELASSLAVLGVTEHHVLGLEDGKCQDADATATFASFIDDVDPDVIVTFGPDGMTGHPDHRAVSAWATAAHLETQSRAELWYVTVTPDFHGRWGHLNDRIGLFADQPRPPSTPAAHLRHEVALAGAALDAKVAALRAHGSQTAALIDMVGIDDYRDWWRIESFRLAGSAPGDLDRPDVARLREALI